MSLSVSRRNEHLLGRTSPTNERPTIALSPLTSRAARQLAPPRSRSDGRTNRRRYVTSQGRGVQARRSNKNVVVRWPLCNNNEIDAWSPGVVRNRCDVSREMDIAVRRPQMTRNNSHSSMSSDNSRTQWILDRHQGALGNLTVAPGPSCSYRLQ